ncbi:MAG TPA: hypothetical protein VF162_02330 [Streptosporangiaceae bacterium]
MLALVASWHAAEEAGRALAHMEQLALLGRVLKLWDKVPDAEQRIGASHVYRALGRSGPVSARPCSPACPVARSIR